MAQLLLTQDVFLIAHDEQSGKNRAAGLPGALAAALLLDLAQRGLIEVRDGLVRADGGRSDDRAGTGDESADDPLLTRALDVIRVEPAPKKVSHWLTALPKALKPIEVTVGTSLVDRGVLSQQHAKALGLFDRTRFPEVDPEPEQQLRSELFGVLVEGAEPSVRTLLLAGLLYQQGLVDRLCDKPDRREARERAKELAQRAETGDELSRAVGETVRATQIAIMAATMTATTAATTAATAGS